jgi:hypothetical protein
MNQCRAMNHILSNQDILPMLSMPPKDESVRDNASNSKRFRPAVLSMPPNNVPESVEDNVSISETSRHTSYIVDATKR